MAHFLFLVAFASFLVRSVLNYHKAHKVHLKSFKKYISTLTLGQYQSRDRGQAQDVGSDPD